VTGRDKGAPVQEVLHVQHQPCPECHSMRTIETALVALKQTLYCPDCGHIWQRNVPPRPPSEA